MLKGDRHHSIKLQRHCNKYGFNDLDFVPMVIGVRLEELIQLEQDCINTLKPYFNICPTAGNSLGFKHSEVSKQKMSKANKGKIITEEARRKIGEAHKGKKLSDETKQKISEAHKGKKLSNEHRRKMSEALKGENHPSYGKQLSEATRRKISEALKGEQNPNFGKQRSDEVKRKVSESKKGFKHSDETKRKLSKASKGKTFSKETRQKISEANRGSGNAAYDHTIYHFYHPEHGDKFCTQCELRKEFSVDPSHLCKLIRGKLKTINGWRFVK